MRWIILSLAFMSGWVLSACTGLLLSPATAPVEDVTQDPTRDAFYYNARLARGINLGNALEAPSEGAWGMTLQEEFFPIIADAGFDSVRIPIKWSVYAEDEPPYTISARIFERVDWVIAQAQAHDLAVVINIHHYDEIMTDPAGQRERFLAIWRQIAEYYQDYPDTLYFELLNEPNASLTVDVWNELWPEALSVIRASNPNRAVIVGPGQWHNIAQLPTLKIPDDAHNIIVTFHYYNPFQFTHQGAEWVAGSGAWLGTEWTGSAAQQQVVIDEFNRAAAWAADEGVPLYMGEFGAYSRADMDSRQRWTSFVARAAEARGFAWSYWEFGAGFGAYDRVFDTWNEPLLNALIPPE